MHGQYRQAEEDSRHPDSRSEPGSATHARAAADARDRARRTTPTHGAGHEPAVSAPGIEPIVATKVAWLTRVDGSIRFSPLYERTLTEPYGAVANAVCELGRQHTAPSTECGCGFHAVSSREDLWRLNTSAGVIVLDVELAGRIVEHEHGWRAEHQVVLGAHLPARCPRCGRPVAGVGTRGPRTAPERSLSWTMLYPVCRRCGRRRVIPVASLAGEMGVEVSIDAIDPPVTVLPTAPGGTGRR
jgi:hypothetical protein